MTFSVTVVIHTVEMLIPSCGIFSIYKAAYQNELFPLAQFPTQFFFFVVVPHPKITSMHGMTSNEVENS